MSVDPPEALILAGPNGAGKTTSSASLVPASTQFLNSDVISARLLEEGHPTAGVEAAAGRLVLQQLHAALVDGESFCIETNLAGRGLVRWIDEWRTRGFTVRLVFVALDSPELAVRRVAGRVASGGHDVAEEVIRRRWAAGLRALFDVYISIVDHWVIFDSSDGAARRVAQGNRTNSGARILDHPRWTRLVALAAQAGAASTASGRELLDPASSIHDDGEPQS